MITLTDAEMRTVKNLVLDKLETRIELQARYGENHNEPINLLRSVLAKLIADTHINPLYRMEE